MTFANRRVWDGFPDVIIHSPESAVKQHPLYPTAKAGGSIEATLLVADVFSTEALSQIVGLVGNRTPLLVSAHAFESHGVNAIPQALSDKIAELTGFSIEGDVVQVNVVEHTGANGFKRMARQALFDGPVIAGQDYLLVDDFIGQGGTLANLRGFIIAGGGNVIGATVLTGKPFSAKLSQTTEQLERLRIKHGTDFETWWTTKFGYAFDCLTESEARYLERTENADRIRDRITEEE